MDHIVLIYFYVVFYTCIQYDKTPLHWATCCFRSECVKLLVNAIVKLDAVDKVRMITKHVRTM